MATIRRITEALCSHKHIRIGDDALKDRGKSAGLPGLHPSEKKVTLTLRSSYRKGKDSN